MEKKRSAWARFCGWLLKRMGWTTDGYPAPDKKCVILGVLRRGHVYILQTPLFRVRNKKETRYCYNDDERANAIKELKNGVEITRFKGLGEISPDEFVDFIGDGMRLDAVNLAKDESISNIMEFYMGDNTIDRQNFIRQNLRSEEELEDIKL